MSVDESKRVIVLGGGILGVSTATQLARGGAEVTLVTSGALGDGASGRSIAWLNSSGDRSAEYHYLRLIAIDRYRSWGALHPDSGAYLRFDGGLKWGAEGESLRETFAYERAAGYDAVWLDRSEIAGRVAGVDVAAVAEEGAIFNPGEGWVDLPSVIAALAAEAETLGVRVIEGAGKAVVDVVEGVARGAILEDGTKLGADAVVLATGPGVPGELDRLGVRIPDATPEAFVLFTRPINTGLRSVLNTPSVAVRPSVSGGVVLDADWAAQSIRVDGGELIIPDESVERLLEEGSRVLHGNPRLEVDRIGAGGKPIPGDGDPVAGAVAAIPGLFVLFTHSGATLGLVLGELVAEEILTGEAPRVLDAFRIERFAPEQAVTVPGIGAWAPVAD